MIDKKGKLFGKISVIDIFVFAALITAVVLAVSKMGGGTIIGAPKSETMRMTFSADSVPACVGDYLEEGALVVDEAKNVALGRILSFKVGDSIEYVGGEGGKLIKTSHPEFCSVEFETELSGSLQERGLLVDGNWYIVGHSMSVKAGDTIVYGRVAGIEEAE